MLRILQITLLIFLVTAAWLPAQDVSTLVNLPGVGFEQVSWGPEGSIFTVDFANNKIYRIGLDGTATEIESINGPLGGAVDQAGNFYVSEYYTGTIIKITPNNEIIDYAGGLNGPAGILLDEANDYMYVANYNSNVVSRLDMSLAQPVPVPLVSGSPLNGPDGLVFAPNGDLIVANFNNNQVSRITPTGIITPFATLTGSPNSGYLVRRGDAYFICGFNSHRLYRLSATGEVSVFAGTGTAATTDGGAMSAAFNQPNGLAISPSGDTLLVGESNVAGGIRMITNLDAVTEVENPVSSVAVQLFPNPVVDEVTIAIDVLASDQLQINILDNSGRLLTRVADSLSVVDRAQLTWHVPEHWPSGVYQLQLISNTKEAKLYPLMINR